MKLSASDSQRVMKAIDKYTKAPESPGLNLEQLEGRTGKRRLWTIRASQGLRVLLVRDGPTWVFLRAGHHDEIYDLAERRTFVVPVDSHPGLISIRPTPPDSGDSAPDRVAEPRQSPYDNKPTIVEHWTTGELARAGFSEDEIDRLRRTTQDTLLEVWPMITDEKLDRVIECGQPGKSGLQTIRSTSPNRPRHREQRLRGRILRRRTSGNSPATSWTDTRLPARGSHRGAQGTGRGLPRGVPESGTDRAPNALHGRNARPGLDASRGVGQTASKGRNHGFP